MDDGLAIPVYVDGVFTDGDVTDYFPYGKDNTFKLASNPTATKTIYLDNNGHHSVNNRWNHDLVFPAFSLDGNTSSFSDAELSEIQKQFMQIVDDFLPFNVNVTTTDPGVAALTKSSRTDNTWGIRAVNTQRVSGDGFGTAGGIAYLTSFSWASDTPTFAFNKGSTNGGMTNSHEIGHSLGLKHDGLGSEEYHPGTGSGATGWGPIMGSPFGKNLAQWSKGDYANSTNTEDDLAIITNARNGIQYRTDDHGNSTSAATALIVTNDTVVLGQGIIERTGDVDYFSFDTGQGDIALQINPVANRASLDVEAVLYNSSGTALATSNPAGLINASFDLTLAKGTYFIRVDGVGKPGVYSDYGSLGYFKIEGTIVKLSNEQPTLNAISDITLNEDAAEQTVTLSGITAGDGESQPLRVTASSNNTDLIANPAVTYTSPQTGGSLTFTPISNASGSAVITVTVEDGGQDGNLNTAADNGIFVETFTVTVNAVNDDPTLDAISDLAIDEDASEQTVDLSGIAAGGGESQPLRVTATSSNTGLIANPTVSYTSAQEIGSLTFTPASDTSGTAVFTVTVEDGGLDGDLSSTGDNATISQTFTVTVDPINDLPTLTALSDLTLAEDAAEQTVDLTGITAGVGENQPLRVTASSNNTNLIANPAVTYTSAETSGSLTFTPIPNANGNTVITVTVEDGGEDGKLNTSEDNATMSQTFTVTVSPVNDIPTLADLGDLFIGEDSSEHSVSLSGITAGGGESQPLKITASSSNGSLIPDPSVNYTSANSTGSLLFTPITNDKGMVTITVTVEDGGLDGNLGTTADNESFSQQFDIHISALPTLDSLTDLEVDEDAAEQTVNLSGITAGGSENQPLRVTASSSNTDLVTNPVVTYTSADSTGSLTFIPVSDASGSAVITVRVEDGGLDGDLDTAGDNLSRSNTITVTVNPVNDIPTLAALSNQTLAEDASKQTVNLSGITAGGSESQPLRVTTSSNNTDLIPNPAVTYTSAAATGLITFTPVSDASGVAVITVTMEDGGLDGDLATSGDNLTHSEIFTVTVNAVNDLPTLESFPGLTINEDDPERTVSLLGITAGGGESQPLRVTASSSNTGLIANPSVIYTSSESTGSINFTSLADANGSTVITVTVEDGGLDGDLGTGNDNVTSSRTFAVTVRPVQDVPLATAGSYQPIENRLLNVTSETGLAQFASDADGEALTFALVTGTSHGQLALAANGSFSYRPQTNFNRTDSFRYKVSDGIDSAEALVTLSIRTDYPWHNAYQPIDVSDDSQFSPLDALLVIDKLNADGAEELSKERGEGIIAPFHDVNRDGHVSMTDALTVINAINVGWSPQAQIRIVATDETGASITDVNEGDIFWVTSYLKDLRSGGKGIHTAYFDILYPSNLVHVTGGAVFTRPYLTGVHADFSEDGLVNEIGASSNLTELTTFEYRQFRLPMKATSAGTAIFVMMPSHRDVLLYGPSEIVAAQNVRFESFQLTILPGLDIGEGEVAFDRPELERSAAPLPASPMSIADRTMSRSSTSAPVAVVEFDRPRVSTSQLSWQRRIDNAIVDLTGEEEELLFGGMDDLIDSIDGLLTEE